jgi:hypothetical protein
LIDKIIFQEFDGDHGPVSSGSLRQVGYRAFLIHINLQKIRYTAIIRPFLPPVLVKQNGKNIIDLLSMNSLL